MSEPEKATSTVYLRRVPKHLKDQFKSVCYRRGMDMKEVLIAFMRRTVEEAAAKEKA